MSISTAFHGVQFVYYVFTSAYFGMHYRSLSFASLLALFGTTIGMQILETTFHRLCQGSAKVVATYFGLDIV